ncbi:MAG: hemerythrin family protein [Aquificae bacterium]|nr:hemerythrin family protein [Aquificota bacterium]
MLLKKEELPQVANPMMNILHEEEVEIVNQLHDALKAKDIEKADHMFKVFLEDIEDHFSTEEDMMRESRFFAYQMHKGEHDTMKQKIYQLYEDWKQTRNFEDLIKFLEDEFKPWLILHISRWDAETAMHVGDTI